MNERFKTEFERFRDTALKASPPVAAFGEELSRAGRDAMSTGSDMADALRYAFLSRPSPRSAVDQLADLVRGDE